MKFSKLFLVGAIALGLVACNNEDVPNTPVTDATVSLKITQTGTRAIGTSELATQESAIKKLDVFVFNGDAVDGHKQATSATTVTEVKDIAVTTGSRTLIVVANATADMGTITSKAALLEKVATDLSAQTLDNGLLMTSEETENFTIAAGKNYYGYTAGQTPAGTEHSVGTPIQLKRVVARVALVGASTNFTGSYDGWIFEPEQVFLFNAKKQSKYFGSSLVHGSEYLSGVDLTSFTGTYKPTNWEAGWVADYLQDAVTDLSAITTAEPVYYYTFENDATVQPTILTIKGKIKNGNNYLNANDLPGSIDANGYTYYSVVVNGALGGYTYDAAYTDNDKKIIRNKQYNITLTIKHPGQDDPTDPPTESAMLDVNVQVVDWVVVNQAVEY